MLNFETVCRTCSLQGELQSLFIEDVLLNPAQMLTEILDIKVIKGDKYPQNICTRCLDSLKSAYLFKNQCHEVYKKFDQFLSLNSENKTIVDCKEELINFIKEENQTDRSENDDEWFGIDDVLVNTIEENFKCHKCNKKLKNQKSYKQHLKRHEQSHSCPICNEKFFTKLKLEKHRRKHFSERSFNCEHCEKSYKHKHQLESHVTLKHADNEIYSSNESSEQTVTKKKIKKKRKLLCDYCGRGFIDVFKLKDHIRTHTGEKPFSCNECNKFFTTQSLLSRHILIHHSNKKPHKCKFCDKSFALSRWLKVHVMVHTNEKPFTCDVCNKKFRQSYHLGRHKFIHTGEKPYSCKICDKKFTRNANVRTHMRIHTGEKPYICSVCGKGFHDSSNMKNHQKKHTLFEENQNVSTSVSNTEK